MHGDQNVKFVFTIQMVLQFPFMAVRLEAGWEFSYFTHHKILNVVILLTFRMCVIAVSHILVGI